MGRTIAHIDMNAFFASVERMCNPSLRGKPVIVCGDPGGRSVVSTASYEAREYGVRSGMPVGEARRLCPDATFLEGDPKKYVYFSLQLLDLYTKFTGDVEPFSIDEAFLDLTGTRFGGLQKGMETGARIKSEIRKKFPDLTASVGLAPNKYAAKMASSLEKPDGLVVIRTLEEYRRKFWPMDVGSLWGVGEKTKEKLSRMGIATIGQLARTPVKVLRAAFGEGGESLHAAAWGCDDTPVVPFTEGTRAKSMGHEHTLGEDTAQLEILEGVLLRLCDQVGRRLRKASAKARTVSVKLRFSDFTTITRQKSLSRYVDDGVEIFRVACGLLREHVGARKVRLIGVAASSLQYSDADQEHLFEDYRRRRLLERAIDMLKDKFGENVLVRAGIVARTRGGGA